MQEGDIGYKQIVADELDADWQRVTADGDGPAESMYISSLWSRRAGEWVNVFSQDTPVETG